MTIDIRPYEAPGSEPPATTPGTGGTRPRRPRRARGSAITWVATTAARRWRMTLGLLIVVVLAGVYAFSTALDREGFPPINTPISVVTGTYFFDDADRVDAEVVAPLADAFLQADDVVEVASEAQPSGFAIAVELDDSIDADLGTQRLLVLGETVPEGASVD